MQFHRVVSASAAALLVAAVGCDRDATSPQATFALQACPVGPLNVNTPITLNLTGPAAPATVSAGNVVVSNALTGFEIPGTLALQTTNGASAIVFTPSAPLPFQTAIRIRVQNILRAGTNTPLPVVVCQVATAPPPITQLFWRTVVSPTGSDLWGGSLYAPDSGYVVSIALPVYRRSPSGWDVVFNLPYFVDSYDVGFSSRTRGFSTHQDQRFNRGYITETRDAAANWDSVFSINGESVRRMYVRAGTGDTPFAVGGGGRAGTTRFLKYNPATDAFTTASVFTGFYSEVNDISFADTAHGAAVTVGVRLNETTLLPGRAFTTSNGGATWTEIPNAAANFRTTTWQGVGRRNNGEIFLAGGNGTLVRLRPGAGGAYTADTLRLTTPGGIANPDTTNPQALILTDVEFAPDNDQRGWVVGGLLVPGSSPGAPPRYVGVIFETVDGGSTWTRQGVNGALNNGADFPKVNRIVPLSSTAIWLIGDQGLVLSYHP